MLQGISALMFVSYLAIGATLVLGVVDGKGQFPPCSEK